MKIVFWGAARSVTGSMHLVEVAGKRLLLDCGLFQGRRRDAFERNRALPFPAVAIDAVVLSHAHIDHAGNLPSLVKAGFRGRIHATPSTIDLSAHMLLDSAHIQESDAERLASSGRFEGARPAPLYTKADAEETMERFTPVDLGEGFQPVPGATAFLKNAGHMLGSAVIGLDLKEGEKQARVVFSGDLGYKGMPILRDPQIIEDADYLLMESTYGDRLHPPASESTEKLRQIIAETVEGGGKVLIPAFAVGRTQEITYRLNQLFEAGELPSINVFIDSPLAANASEVFRRHPECFDVEMLDAMLAEDDHDPLSFSRLRYIRLAEESKRITASKTPAVIISASGMCESGRILHHLREGISNPKNTLLFVGYQAENTLGRRLLNGAKVANIFGDEFPVRARVERVEGCSAHADQAGLLEWAIKVQKAGKLKNVFLVHGESPAMNVFSALLKEKGFPGVTIPDRAQTFEF